MSKLFIYAIFLYLVYRLVTGGRKKKVNQDGAARQKAEASRPPVHDQLVEDPVCHIYIPKRQAIVLQESETPVFFCSEQCRKMYIDAQTTHRQEKG